MLDSCFYNCFVCGSPFTLSPKLDKGKLEDMALFFSVIIDARGNQEETEERIWNKCWVSDLTQLETLKVKP
jgi:hypothetical protein